MSGLAQAWLSVLEPPPDLSVSQWAELHRMLPEASAARGGHWSNSTAPYLRGIMDASREPGVRKMALMAAHQVGKTESLNNIVGYHIHHDPCPIRFLFPTHEGAANHSKGPLADMIRSTPALAAVVRDRFQPRSMQHQADSTIARKEFPGGFVLLGGGNSPTGYQQTAARIAIADEVDRLPPTIADEGDPVDLLINRTTSFYDSLCIFVSTPTLKGGRIDTLYSRSDQRRYFVTCPHCDHQDWITWSDVARFRVAYEGEEPESARLECGPCGALMTEPERRLMIAKGEWFATEKAKEPGLAGFHLPAMVSTLGDVTLEGLVAKWLSARARGKEALRVFINTSLGEGWEDKGAKIEPHSLLSRRESYGEGIEVPASAPCLTAGVDVQIDRFELQVLAWGLFGERWVVDTGVVPGDPKNPETQAALLEALGRRYRHASGHWLPIHAACVDSGYIPETIYGFTARNRHRRFYATKGIGGKRGEPILLNAVTKVPILVNADGAKGDVMASVGLAAPGPGYCHFPERVDEEYFAQLLSEHSQTKKNTAGVTTHEVWVVDRTRNEALDTAVLALAAFRILAGGKENDRIRSMAAVLASTPVPEETPGSTPAAAPPPVPERVQRPQPRTQSWKRPQ